MDLKIVLLLLGIGLVIGRRELCEMNNQDEVRNAFDGNTLY